MKNILIISILTLSFQTAVASDIDRVSDIKKYEAQAKVEATKSNKPKKTSSIKMHKKEGIKMHPKKEGIKMGKPSGGSSTQK